MSLPFVDLSSHPTPNAPLVRREIRASGLVLPVVADPADGYFQSQTGDPDAFEPALAVAALILPADGVAIDVGACLGTVSLGWTMMAPSGTVVAIEPGRSALPGLVATLRDAPGQVRVLHAAAGDHSHVGRYRPDAGGAAWGHLTDDPQGESIDVVTIDQVVDELGLDRLDLIKIDVEGNELRALEGAVATLQRLEPTVVVECNPFCLWRYGRTFPQDLVDWIRRRFPFVWRIAPDRSNRRLQTDDDFEGFLNEVGTVFDLCDIVASHRPLDLPAQL